MTMTVLNTSDAECTASETIAAEFPATPAINFPMERIRLTIMLFLETRIAICSSVCLCISVNLPSLFILFLLIFHSFHD